MRPTLLALLGLLAALPVMAQPTTNTLPPPIPNNLKMAPAAQTPLLVIPGLRHCIDSETASDCLMRLKGRIYKERSQESYDAYMETQRAVQAYVMEHHKPRKQQ